MSDQVEQPSLSSRLKTLFVQYGKIAVSIHVLGSILTFLIFFALLSSGIDVASLLANFGFQVEKGSTGSLTATAIAAFVLQKVTSPPRMLLTLAITPMIAQYLGVKKPEQKTQ
ncbi:transmembrane protein [Planoprotostelium fungivorum]|uniref:Transmembrane protein n=1 Tax=Planoprotostelium fungivorum TaxID=1890364 RepID=A0A2P6N4Q3_9EUKA|nr:transmembrane protein [Planoprotostelium fungivorum]